MAESVLILGGGVGGLVAANRLRRMLPRDHRIVLVEREPAVLFQPSLLWLMTGARTAEQITRPTARLERKGVEVIRGEVGRIDPVRREVSVNGRTLGADYLIIALGADLDPGAIPGLAEAGHNLYALSGVEALRRALGGFAGGKLIVLTAAPMYKCPAAPYEAALLLEDYLRGRKLRDRTALEVYAAEPGPMGVAGPEVSRAVRQMIESRGIAYHPEHQIIQADPGTRRISFANGASASYDLLVYIPPHRGPAAIRESGLASESGWMAVDRHTMATAYPRVYALGDVVSIPLALGKPLPKAGVFAHAEAEVVARNLAREITGQRGTARFTGEGACFIETGGGKAGFGRGNFYAEPVPQVKLYPASRLRHLAKVLFEKDWLRRWF